MKYFVTSKGSMINLDLVVEINPTENHLTRPDGKLIHLNLKDMSRLIDHLMNNENATPRND